MGDSVLRNRISPNVKDEKFVDLPSEPFNYQDYLGMWARTFASIKVETLTNGVVKGYFMDENGENCCISRKKYAENVGLKLKYGDAVMCFWYNPFESESVQ